MNTRDKIRLAFALALAIVVGALLVPVSQAQTDSWAVCENPQNGARQSFKGGCPAGWIFISW